MSYSIMADIENSEASNNILDRSIMYEIQDSDTDTETPGDTETPSDTHLYKMEIESSDKSPYCIICLEVTPVPYGCFQCKECIICSDCIEKLPSKHKQRCPVCRKGKKWCKIIETNKAYILNINENEVIRNNTRQRNQNIILRERHESNRIIYRSIVFLTCLFLPYIVYMGLKILE
jgi:hypothetical protein